MTQLASRIYADLLFKPYAIDGRGPAAYDCVGLVMTVLGRMGVEVPAYLSSEEELHRQLAAGGALEDCHRIPEPEAGAVVLLRSTGVARRHIGVMIDPHQMIHASEPAGQVVRERLASSIWRGRAVGYYRVGA